METPAPQEIPPKKSFSLIKCLWAIFKDMDRWVHDRFMRAFPRAIPVFDAVLEELFGVVTHAAFALIVAALLGVLVLTGVIKAIVFWSILFAWAVAVLWIARAERIRALTVTFRSVFIGIIGVLLAIAGNSFGHWALNASNREKAAEHLASDKRAEPKGEEPKKELPKVESPLTTKKKIPAKPEEKGEPPAFAVAEELSILSSGGNGYGTRFWLRTPTPRGCTISQAQAVIYLRIENLRPYPVTVVSYTLEAIKPMIRLSALHHSIFGMSAPGESFYGATRIGEVVPAQQGSGLFAWSQILPNKLDFSRAKLLEMDTLDEQIIKPLAPNVPVRGWAFFEYPLDKEDYMIAIATGLSIRIKTERGELFLYSLPVENGDSNGDVLPRDWKVKDIVDVTGCEKMRYQLPP